MPVHNAQLLPPTLPSDAYITGDEVNQSMQSMRRDRSEILSFSST